jgi:serine/threonine protein phosphatase PrpC
MEFNLQYTCNSKKGIEREKNQDRILVIEKDSCYLFMIFDGVSSHPFSYLFINEYKKIVRSKFDKLNIVDNNLDKILYEAHKEVLNFGINGMSTLSVLFFNKFANCVKYINIGDSRIYGFTNQFLEKLTTDDSLPGRENIITRCLGIETLSLLDFKMIEIELGYNYLMCSDGFYKLMEENLKEYFTTINFKNFRNIKKKISFLQRRKNRDDSSYIIIKDEISS